jgi:hypothetical protein
VDGFHTGSASQSSKQKQKAFKNQTISLIFKRFIYAASDNYLSS